MLKMTVMAALLSLSIPVHADQYGAFERLADSGSIKPFARDLGGVLGSSTFHSARSLGFSGFDVGVRGVMQFGPDRDNRILRGNGIDAFGLPWVQAEIGMPFRFDGFIRGISYQGLTIAGGGLRYGLLKRGDAPWTPHLLASGVGHSVVHEHFSASHVGGNLVGSMGIPLLTPYVGIGFDRTRVVVRSSTADPLLIGHDVTTFESRFTAGAQTRPWPFFYLHAAYVLLHRQSGAEAGMGIRF
ncbi:MAG: hypothetical protein HY549_10770 [Elusimicrobia bacterium]|nr:hypothetical protein [Elusimicrobiota bacterium]